MVCILISKHHLLVINSLYYLLLLGSKTLGTKCIRTSFCVCWQTMIKTMSLGLSLIKVCLSVSLNQVFCMNLLCKTARLDRSKVRLNQSKHAVPEFCRKVSNVAQAHMTCRVKCFTNRLKGKTLTTF